MKDRTQELRSVSLGVGKMGGTPMLGERVGVEWGRCWDVGATGGWWQGRHDVGRHLMFSSEHAFWRQWPEGLEALKTQGVVDTPHSQQGPESNLGMGKSECQERIAGCCQPSSGWRSWKDGDVTGPGRVWQDPEMGVLWEGHRLGLRCQHLALNEVSVCAHACVALCEEGTPLRDKKGRGGLRRQPDGQGLRRGDPRGGRWGCRGAGRKFHSPGQNWVVCHGRCAVGVTGASGTVPAG